MDFIDRGGILTIIVCLPLLQPLSCVEQILTVPPNAVCACPGEVLTYTCAAVGAGSTVWRGSAFDCPNNQDQIILRHSEFESMNIRECNNGLIVGQPLMAENDCFISQLNISISAGLNNKTIECRATLTTIGISTLNIISEPYPPPNSINLASVDNGELIFTWNPVNNCSSIDFLISATDGCGTCPNSTNTTSVTCTTAGLSLTSTVTICTFEVQSKVCGYVSNHSNRIMIPLKVPDVPLIQVVPRYSNENQSLISIKIFVQQMDLFNFTDNISGSPSCYNIIYANETSPVSACNGSTCEYTLKPVPCSENIKIAVSAVNQLGEGMSTDVNSIDCLNQFVQVEIDPSTSTITCTFLYQPTAVEKTCSITYSVCQWGPSRTVTSEPTRDDTITLPLEVMYLNQTFCFIVRATSGQFTTEVEGTFKPDNLMDASSNTALIATVTTLVPALLLAAIIIIIIVILVVVKKRKPKNKQKAQTEDVDTINMQSVQEFESVVRGYHAYKQVWTPVRGAVLQTEPEPDNKVDPYAVKVIKSEGDTVRTVGYLAREISKPCSIFIQRGGQIKCKITGGPKPQELTQTEDEERLEVPCIYVLSAEDEKTLNNVVKILQAIKEPLVKWKDH